MIDQGEQDDKIIGVHADDPEYKEYTDISELPAHRLAEIKRCKKRLHVHSRFQVMSLMCEWI